LQQQPVLDVVDDPPVGGENGSWDSQTRRVMATRRDLNRRRQPRQSTASSCERLQAAPSGARPFIRLGTPFNGDGR
jgi:hypothetical protein